MFHFRLRFDVRHLRLQMLDERLASEHVFERLRDFVEGMGGLVLDPFLKLRTNRVRPGT
jgi:hypothetical protein